MDDGAATPLDGRFLFGLEGAGYAAADVGSKAAALDRLVAAGFRVPDAAAVTTSAYRLFVEQNGLARLIVEAGSRPIPPPGKAEEQHRVLEEAFLEAPMTPWLVEALHQGWETLGSSSGLAVRSSASFEDLAGASFAGQYLSVLDVEGFEQTVTAVRRVWASLWHPWADAYRRQLGIADRDPAMAVVLQRMVPAERSGVVFTVDPAASDLLRLEVVSGLGEPLVSGKVTPDVHQFRRSGLRPVGGGAPDPLLREVAHTALLVEERFGGTPQDIEWSIAGGRVWILQARPITTLDLTVEEASDGFDTPTEAEARYVSTGVDEMLPGVLSPLLWTINAPMVEEAYRQLFDRLGALPAGLEGPFGFLARHDGRANLNLTVMQQAAERMAGWSPAEVERLYLGAESGEAPDPVGRGRLRTMASSLRAARLRRTAVRDADAFGRVVRAVIAHRLHPTMLLDSELVASRWRIRDLAASGVSAEVAVAAAAIAAYRALELTLERWVGAEGRTWAQRLTTDAGAGLETPQSCAARVWAELDEDARARVAAVLEGDGESSVDEALERLGPTGLVISEKLRRELDRLGSAAVYGGPTWSEEADYVWKQLRSSGPLLADRRSGLLGAGGDLELLERRLAGSWRWRLTRVLTGQLVDVRRRVLRRLVRSATLLLAKRESAKAALLALGGEERRVLRELARRLVERGALDRAEDVELLADWELDDLILDRVGVGRVELERRRRAIDGWRAGSVASRFSADVGLRFRNERNLVGWGVSPGRHRGPARVVFDPASVEGIESGDVVVAPGTDPSWIPLLQQAGALVIERGGPLSHAAILARELGIPAVVNAVGATTLLSPGVEIEVDGTRGEVWVGDWPERASQSQAGGPAGESV